MLAVAGLTVLIAGCGSGAAPPVATLAPGTSPATTRPGHATVSPSPNPSAELSGKSVSPSPDLVATIDDPALTMRLPSGWHTTPVALLRAQVEQLSLSGGPVLGEIYKAALADIDAGAVRLFASGPSGFNPWQASMVIEVKKAVTVDVQIAAIKANALRVSPPTTSDQTSVTLSIGAAERLSETADPPVGARGLAVAAHAIDYVVQLDDGRILWINTTGPEASLTFAAMVDAAVASLTRH